MTRVMQKKRIDKDSNIFCTKVKIKITGFGSRIFWLRSKRTSSQKITILYVIKIMQNRVHEGSNHEYPNYGSKKLQNGTIQEAIH